MEIIKDRAQGISIIICCYNSSKRLPETIKHIAQQILTKKIDFEVLIINNASTDDTFKIAADECSKYLFNIPYKVIQENDPGLASARKRGIIESAYTFLLFCDDDNWLNSNYVQLAYDIMSKDPLIGVLGSQSIGEYEVPPPPWFLKVSNVFAIGKQAEFSQDITHKRAWVRGAGFVIPYAVFNEIEKKGIEFFLSGRKGNKLSSGEDKELCFAIRDLGYKIIYQEDLILKHFMPSERFNYTKLISMAYHSGKSAYIDDLYNNAIIKKFFALYWLIAVLKSTTKLVLAVILRPFALLNFTNPVRNDQRYAYSTGVLSTLFNLKYCLQTLKILKEQTIYR